jgi:hypothetical protein
MLASVAIVRAIAPGSSGRSHARVPEPARCTHRAVVDVGTSINGGHPHQSSVDEATKLTRGRRDVLAAFTTSLALMRSPSGARAADDTSAACSSCEGPVDGTLGRCEGFGKDDCRSCFDDRPPYFAAPWEFEGTAREAVRAIQDAVAATGGRLQGLPRGDGDGDAGTSNTAGANDDTAGGFYVRGVFGGNDSIVLEFLVDESDAVCEVRGTQASDTKPRVGVPRFGSPVDRQLELVRKQVGWLEVPILRNRKINALVGMETPWDSFGPTPPPTMDEMYGSDARRLDDPLQ